VEFEASLVAEKSMVGSEGLYSRQPLIESTYRRKLVQEVYRKLRKALEGPSPQRADVLRQLFADIVLEVDARAQARLYGLPESPEGSGRDRLLCFYEVLAEHYAQKPEDAKEVLRLIVKLWSQSLAGQIFTLLFYQWLFEVLPEDTDGYVRYSTAFVEGASTIFWIDLQSNMRRFFSLYYYTLTEVVTNPERHRRIQSQDHRQLLLMLSRFFFFYEPDADLEEFLAHFPKYPNMGPADVFVIELTDQLQKVKIEPVLLRYMVNARCLKGFDLSVATSVRLKTALYAFTSPGGPMYPTRPVRHAAWETLDVLFPVGRNSRYLIALMFRLIHPYYWPYSFLNFVWISTIGVMRVIYFFMLEPWKLLFSCLRKPIRQRRL
jgi:hypothetical protein